MSKPQDIEPDPNPLAAELIEKTKAGKLKWEPTVDRRAFIVSLGGDTTLKLHLDTEEQVDPYGQLETVTVACLSLLDAKGNILWDIRNHKVKGGLMPLYKLAQRVANKVDERLANIMDSLRNL